MPKPPLAPPTSRRNHNPHLSMTLPPGQEHLRSHRPNIPRTKPFQLLRMIAT